MSLFSKLAGKATVGANLSYVEDYLLEGEEIIISFQFIRDCIIFSNLGIYYVDVQGIGTKVEVKFFPRKNIKSVSFETAGTMDLDVDIKIGVDGNTVMVNNIPYSAPLSFKVPKGQKEEAKKIVNIVKQYYLC